MIYTNMVPGIFVSRPNRFVAKVIVNGVEETVHVKNTGRCKELLQPGCRVSLQKASNPNRKTPYDLISVYKESLGWVNIDSQVPNALVKEWLESGSSIFPDLTLIRSEFTYGKSRVDFYLECKGPDGLRRILMEVKGCTLEIDGIGYFPDAPTERGVKHLRELTSALEAGYESYLAFVIAMPQVKQVVANRKTHPEFADALETSKAAGVKVLQLACEVKEDEIHIISSKQD